MKNNRKRSSYFHSVARETSLAAYRTPAQEFLFGNNNLIDFILECTVHCNALLDQIYFSTLSSVYGRNIKRFICNLSNFAASDNIHVMRSGNSFVLGLPLFNNFSS